MSTSQLLALNPQCLPDATFPKENQQPAVFAFANALLAIFKGTIYVPPSGVDVGGQHVSQHQFVFLQGAGFRGVEATSPKKDIHVNSLISMTESAGYWVAWVTLADDQGKKDLIRSNIQFKEE